MHGTAGDLIVEGRFNSLLERLDGGGAGLQKPRSSEEAIRDAYSLVSTAGGRAVYLETRDWHRGCVGWALLALVAVSIVFVTLGLLQASGGTAVALLDQLCAKSHESRCGDSFGEQEHVEKKTQLVRVKIPQCAPLASGILAFSLPHRLL